MLCSGSAAPRRSVVRPFLKKLFRWGRKKNETLPSPPPPHEDEEDAEEELGAEFLCSSPMKERTTTYSASSSYKMNMREMKHNEDGGCSDAETVELEPISPRFMDHFDHYHDHDHDDEPVQCCMPWMHEQSPIDIREATSDFVTMKPGELTASYSASEARLIHQGHNFKVEWCRPEDNTLTINGKDFHAVQFHLHTPSEHTVDGQSTAMELHMVHQAADGSLAVIGILFQVGAENKFLEQFWDELPETDPEVRNRVYLGRLDPKPLGLLSGRFFRYRGSLTTPPYTEGVEWIVMQTIAEASRDQIETFVNALPGPNARSVQPLNKRVVQLVH